jgi:deazaflavin-dependent oxidoreductase (nitroreductase family)
MSTRYSDANAFQRLLRRTAATRPMSWLYARTLMTFDRMVYRLTGGRSTFTASAAGLPVVMLTTTGAKTGQARTAPVLGIEDGERLIIVATNYGKHRCPSWVYNLRSTPLATVTVGNASRKMQAHEVTGAEWERYFADGTEVYPGFAQYRERVGREIPIFRLEPLAPGA